MTQCFRRKESAVEPVCILATAVFAVLAAAGVATLVEVRGLLDRPHSVLLDLSAAETDQCVVERDEMTSSGSDAKLVWNVFSDDGIRLDVRVDAGEGTFLDAFWGTPDQPSFSPARCIRTPLSAGHNRLALPIRGKIRRLRLDFGNAPGQTFRVSSIRARSGLRLERPWSWSVFGLRSAILFFPVFLLFLHVAISAERIWPFIDRNRFAIAAAVLLVAVQFELHGSSIGVWNRHVPNPRAESPLFGVERAIRSDEYAVFTPMTLAQSFAKPSWPYFNDIPRADRTDMFSVYAQPVRHPLLAFRPFLAGHVLFGFERGLAFFWFGRWLALLLVVYELLKLLTDGNKPLSGVGAMLVVLSPVVQWWGAINALAEMLIFGSLFVLCLHRFMRGTYLRDRWLPVVGMGYSCVAYAMTLYPAAQVPFAYAFGALSLWTVLRRAKGFRADAATWAFAGGVALAAAGCLGWYLHLSGETFHVMSDTVYPGSRFDCGGGFRKGFGLFWGNLLFPWTSPVVEDGNSFNRAMFPDFFPLGFGLAAFLFVRRRVRDLLSVLLVVVAIVLSLYCVTGFPRWLAGLSLLSRSTSPRAFVALGFVQLLLLLRSVSLLRPLPSVRDTAPITACFAAVAMLFSHLSYPLYLSAPCLLAAGVVAATGCWCFLRFHALMGRSALFFAVFAVCAGAFVNPVQRGDAGILDSDLARTIRSIANSDDGIWLVEGASFPMNQYPLLAGARTVNAGNLYPLLERWRELDPAGTAEKTWNRYAVGIRFDVKPGAPTSISLTGFDTFRVECSPDVLNELGVRHILSRNGPERFSVDGLQAVPEKRVSGWNVYSLTGNATAGPEERPD